MIIKLFFILIIFEGSVTSSGNRNVATSVDNVTEYTSYREEDEILSESDPNYLEKILFIETIKLFTTQKLNVTFLEETSKIFKKYNATLSDYYNYLVLLNQMEITEETFDKLMTMIVNIFPIPSYDTKMGHSYNDFIQSCIKKLSDITSKYQNVHKDWAIKIWRPFADDITGIALYKNYAENLIKVEEINRNQSMENINTIDLEVAAYVPYVFLKELIKNDLGKDKNLTIVMTIMNGQKFKTLWGLEDVIDNIVGISIPEYCKYVTTTLIKVFFKGDFSARKSNWVEFGNNYLDIPRHVTGLTCSILKFLFFGRSKTNKGEYFESINFDYCNITSNGVNIPMHVDAQFPPVFCMDEHRVIPTGHICFNKIKPNCYNGHQTSNETELYYELFLQCSQNTSTCYDNFLYIAKRASTPADVAIAFRITTFYKFQSDSASTPHIINNLIIKLLRQELTGLIKLQGESQILELATVIAYFASASQMTEDYTFIHPHLTYQQFACNSSIIGSVVYKDDHSSENFNIKPLHASNATTSFSSYDNVEVIFFISNPKHCYPDRRFRDKCHLFVINDKFTEYQNETCTSKIVAFVCENYQYQRNFTIYLRSANDQDTGEDKKNNGYLVNDELGRHNLTVMYISEWKNNGHYRANQLNVFERHLLDKPAIHLRNRITKTFDLS